MVTFWYRSWTGQDQRGPAGHQWLPSLVLIRAEEVVEDVKIGGSLSCSNHALVELAISRNMGLAKSGVKTLNFRRVNFSDLFKEWLNEIS